MRLIIVIVLALLVSAPAGVAAQPQVRLGYLSVVAGQSVIVNIIQETNILELVGLNVQFFDIVPPSMAEGIAAKRLDIEIVGDMPMATQVSAGFPIQIIAALWDFRHTIMTNNPAIQSLKDLRGRKLATPFGTTAYLDANQQTALVGLEPGKTVELVNVSPGDIATAIRGKNVDAVSIWDPIWVVLEREGMRRLVTIDHSGYTVARTEFVQSNPDIVVKFLQAQILATAFRAKYQRESAERHAKRVGIKEPELVMLSQNFDRNWNAKSVNEVQLEPTATDVKRLAEVMDVGHKLGLLKRKVTPDGLIDTTLLRRAVEGLKAAGMDVDKVKYVR